VRLWNGLVHRQIHRRGVHVPGGGSSAAAEMKSETVTHTFDRASPERLDRSATSADDLDSRLDVLVVRRATPRARSGCSSPRRARTSVTFAVHDTTAAASPVLRAFREDAWRYIEVDSARGRHAPRRCCTSRTPTTCRTCTTCTRPRVRGSGTSTKWTGFNFYRVFYGILISTVICLSSAFKSN
jgi:hypothetical protein